ncbi:MAG: substrate-binding domain-containing protein [Desulfobacterales bacterium]|jgi:tungstate transport system substrate-binding protein|nr:substrate-binding domain-containing protein [Desulfobacteraceae bacterium]MDD3991662.1 substrate-binding domain-containing protein [Desulfobacteraceae bacterium]MDY0311162.1 substrate-binding domain-containing protein [Desulfobacterales bacterium]
MNRFFFRFALIAVWAGILFLTAGAVGAQQTLMMATTTSTDNTGLLDSLIPEFTKDTGIELKWTATGTGKALKLGENCDVDVLLVHAPAAEKKYVADGFGINRRQVMYNDFVLIGPAADPAGIKGKTVRGALEAIRAGQQIFVSRGDNSGTHKQELALWQAAEGPVPEKEPWYVQTGQGMLTTINVAAERSGYTMTDRGTYIKYEATLNGNPPLKILVEGDDILLNQYSVITVNPTRCPTVKADLAETFSRWMIGERAQNLIGDFKLLGKQLFTPNAAK